MSREVTPRPQPAAEVSGRTPRPSLAPRELVEPRAGARVDGIGPVATKRVVTVLIVDDEPSLRNAFRRQLTQSKVERDVRYGCEMANNGSEGLARYREGGVDIVITDLHMPIMDGLTMLRAIRAEAPSAKVIAMTGMGSEKEKGALREAGAFEVLNKPVDLMVLEETLRRAVGQ